jgi:hypothetical protein
MTMRSRLAYAIVGVAILLGGSCAWAQQVSEPWKEPQDTAAALFEPDKYAWKLFVALNWPADPAQKVADPSKPFGAPGPVVWETWRNIMQGAPDTVFPALGADPGPWLGSGSPAIARQERQFDPAPRQLQVFRAIENALRPTDRPGLAPAFDAAVGAGNEVRMNQSAYEFVRQSNLYNVEGQVAQFAAGKENLNFPPNAKEVKAQWRKIKEADKPRYHWAEVTLNNGQKESWGLTALHISTKDLPNWLWTTFEHIDNKTPGQVDGGPPNLGWMTKSSDKFACPSPPHDCEKAPTGIGVQGTKWENYRLRGSQIDFVTSFGTPTVLANGQIEAPFQRRSSCITCHARATISRDGTQDIGFFPPLTGAPTSSEFFDAQTGQRTFMQLDFVWSLRRASSMAP